MRRLLLGLPLILALACGAPAAQDSGVVDAGTPDAGASDAGAPDGGSPDAGPPDAGPPDAGPPDAGPRLDDAGCVLPDNAGPPFRLRAVAANLTSGTGQTWDPGHGQRILQGLAADVVMIQEFNYGARTPADNTAFVTATFDAGYVWTRGGGQIPNGVISRWPLLATGEWADALALNRGFTWAKVDLPGPRDLWVVSVHLLTTGATLRDQEGQALLQQLDRFVPSSDFLLVGGDLNTGSRTETVLATLSRRLVVGAPHPADSSGNGNTNAGRDQPYDWVLASRCLVRAQAPVVIGAQRFDAGLVVDTRVYSPLADLSPALATDSAAPGMQHMAVVKDFLVTP